MKRKVFALQHIACEGLGIIEKVFQDRGVPYCYIRLDQGEKLPTPEEISGNALVILGGPMNVYEEERYPYLKEETELIRYGLDTGIPMIGICLGAQLIAKAAGARVYAGKAKEIGWYPVNLESAAAEDALFSQTNADIRVFQWHGDTFDLPVDAVNLASSVLFPNQAYRLNNNVYALQFHLEVTREMILAWGEEYEKEIRSEEIDIQKLFRNTEEEIENLNRFGSRFFTHFTEKFLELDREDCTLSE